MKVERFPISNDGAVEAFKLSNKESTLVAQVSTFGARLTHLWVQDKDGNMIDVLMGFNTHEDLIHSIQNVDDPYIGAVIGRISGSVLPSDNVRLNGTNYKLNVNVTRNGASHHGGNSGFDKKNWTGEIISGDLASVKLTYKSKNNEENYPGSLLITLIYTVTDNNEIKLEYHGELVDEDLDNIDFKNCVEGAVEVNETALSLTNHAYFNLTGFKESTIHDHYCSFISNNYLLADMKTLVVNGTCINDYSENKPDLDLKYHNQQHQLPEKDSLYDSSFDDIMDFSTKPKKIGEGINSPLLASFKGYDHVYSTLETKKNHSKQELAAGINPCPIYKIQHVASIWSETSGIRMNVLSDEPSIVFYTGNWISNDLVGKNNTQYGKQCALSIECQRYNNAVNIDKWREQVILKRGQVYSQNTIYQFTKI
ncbi:Aldose 1-epimerase [Smittium culicis]|uniref:Aldose 1-epimerase n=1 Tax=Smittium culicis TaxID=133412 RepID=A0A1R1XN48_9FUNG|nr:Aldose 1-epimerase [Smittium culicis]